MAKIPKRPEEIFPEITDDCRKLFGEELISIILYGSGAGGDYIPGKSDLNFLILLSDRGIDQFDRALEAVGRWRKRNVAIPLFMSRCYLSGALDAYPIEFLNMKRQYRVVYGEDIFAPLTFDPPHVRLQLERELRGKLIHLRSGYLAAEGKTGKIRELIGASLTAFVSLLSAILYLKKLEIPKGKRDVITAASTLCCFDAAVFLKCEEIQRKADPFSSAEVQTLFRDYLRGVGQLCELVDGMDVQS